MKSIILYHANCIDGIVSATVTLKHIMEDRLQAREDIITLAVDYDDDFITIKDMLKELHNQYIIDKIYIVDFSYSMAQLLALADIAPTRVIDHHASAFRNLVDSYYDLKRDSREYLVLHGGKLKILLDNNESGASLCFKHFFYDPNNTSDAALPNLVRYAKDYDLYRFEDDKTKAINKFLKSYAPYDVDDFLSAWMYLQTDIGQNAAYDVGRSLLKYEETLEDAIIARNVTPITIATISGLAVQAPMELASSIGNKLAAQSETFGCVYEQQAHGAIKFSLRSIGDNCDVSRLAELFDGGGHRNAAGFTLQDPTYNPDKGITIWTKGQEESDA